LDDLEDALLLDHDHHHDVYVEECPWCPFIDMHDPYTQRIISFCIGLLHGVAGPGGILGVLPAVEMQRWSSSVLYLGSFIVTSTLSMGVFAALYGEITRRLGTTTESMELYLSIFSSAMSIIVGCIWFVLSVLGKLDEFFE
jgi:predicted membrane protein